MSQYVRIFKIRNSIFHFDKKKQFLPAKKSKKYWIFCKFDKKKYNSIHTLNCKGKNNNSQQQRNPKFLFLSTFRRNFWRIIFIIIIILLKKKNFKKYISYAATLLPTKFFIDVLLLQWIFCNIYFILKIFTYQNYILPTLKTRKNKILRIFVNKILILIAGPYFLDNLMYEWDK